MRRLALLLVAWSAIGSSPAVHGQQPSQARDDDAGVLALLSRLERAVQSGNPENYLPLLSEDADRTRAVRFANEEIHQSVTRAVLREEGRQPLPGIAPGQGFHLMVDELAESGNRARVATWQLEVRRVAGGAWAIDDASKLSSMEGLYRLSLNTGKQFDARGFALRAEDLDLSMEEGSAFTIDTDQGVTGLVLIGRGNMRFHPTPPAEKGQVKIFSGAETLDTRFDAVYVRFGGTAGHADLSRLVARQPDPRDVKRAADIFREESPKSFGLDLGDLTRDSWSLLPAATDFLAEIQTRKFDTLTYSRSASLPEDISLFDRKRQHNIAVYPSVERLAARGPFYDEDDSSGYDILDYNVEVEFTPARQWIDGRATIHLKIKSSPTGQFVLRLANSLTVRSIVSERFGRLYSLRIKGQNLILVSLPAILMPDTDLTMTVIYGGRLAPQPANQETVSLEPQSQQPLSPGSTPPTPAQSTPIDQMQQRTNDLERMTDESAFLRPEQTYLYSNRNFWYPQAQVSDYATGTLKVTIPADLTCVASGELTSDSPKFIAGDTPEQSKKIFTFVASRPVRYLSFVVSRFIPVERLTMAFDETPEARRASLARNAPSLAGEYDAIDLAILTNPRQTQRGRELASRAADIAQFYQSLVGDSPYQSFSVALIESMLPGGHSPAYFAVLDQPLPNAPVTWRDDPAAFSRYPEFFLAHELAHQWWGQAVGWQNYHEQWLSEGFAQYFAALYAQHARGDDTFASMLRQMRKWSMDESDQGPVYFGYRVGHIRGDSRAFRAIVYDKGAVVLHMLRRLIGDDAFFKGIRRFYVESRFDKAGTDDLRRAMEAESGQKLERFFERWIYGSTLPHLKFTSQIEHDASGKEQAVLRFEQTGEIFDLPVTVTLQYADRRSVDVVVPVMDRMVEKRVPLDGKLRSIEVSKDDGTLAEIGK